MLRSRGVSVSKTILAFLWSVASQVERYFACASIKVASMIMTAIPTNNPIILKPAIRRDVSDVDRLRVAERDRDIRDSQNPCSSLLDGVLCSSLLASSELGDRH